MKVALILLTVFATHASGAIRFKKCGPASVSRLTIEGTDNARTPIVHRGEEYTIEVEYTAGSGSDGIDNLETKWYCLMNGQDMPWRIPMEPGCSTISPPCPVAVDNQYIYRETFTVPEDAPKMRAAIKLTQQSGDITHLCVMMSLDIQ